MQINKIMSLYPFVKFLNHCGTGMVMAEAALNEPDGKDFIKPLHPASVFLNIRKDRFHHRLNFRKPGLGRSLKPKHQGRLGI